jgi:hypothetical protein
VHFNTPSQAGGKRLNKMDRGCALAALFAVQPIASDYQRPQQHHRCRHQAQREGVEDDMCFHVAKYPPDPVHAVHPFPHRRQFRRLGRG